MSSRFILVVLVTGFWYFASSINVVASQKLFSGFKDDVFLQNGLEEFNALTNRNATGIIFLAVLLTVLQLLAGALLSVMVLSVFDGPQHDNHSLPHIDQQSSYSRIHKLKEFFRHIQVLDLQVGCLHCVGNICTNIGYGYGSASVVQVIKLLEPIETLLLTALVQASLKVLSPRKVVSTLTIVGGTYMLLSNPSIEINPTSVLFALGSGICMASRNVFSKKRQSTGHHNEEEEEEEVLVNDTNNHNETFQSNLLTGMKKFATITITSASSAVVIGFCLAVTNLPLAKIMIPGFLQFTPTIRNQAIVFHCGFSMAAIFVLSWTSATTHSLLNVGKRIANVVVASLAFDIPLTLVGKIGLGIAAIGGCIYNDKIVLPIASQWNCTTNLRPQYVGLGLTIVLLLSFQKGLTIDLGSMLDKIGSG